MDSDYTEGTHSNYSTLESYSWNVQTGEIKRLSPIVRGGMGCMGGVAMLLPLAAGAVLTALIFIVSVIAEPRLWLAYIGLGGLWLWRHRLAVTGYSRGRRR